MDLTFDNIINLLEKQGIGSKQIVLDLLKKADEEKLEQLYKSVLLKINEKRTNKAKEVKCIICGKKIEKKIYFDPICSQECFRVNFWNEQLNDKAIIIGGECYHVGEKQGGSLGFGGAKFTIQMNDGRIIETNNLWYNGKVPEDRKVKDNAKFVKRGLE